MLSISNISNPRFYSQVLIGTFVAFASSTSIEISCGRVSLPYGFGPTNRRRARICSLFRK